MFDSHFVFAFMRIFYRRLRHRPSTARYNTPLHSAHALTLRAAAIAVPGSADSTNAPGVVGVNESKPSTARPSSATVVVSGNGKSTNPASAGAIAGKAEPLSVQYSSLHSLSGYIDIGDAEVFQAAWVQPASEKLVIDHARQLKTEH